MKVIPSQVPKTGQEAFRLQIDALPYFYDRLHQHSETQIMLIEKGEGTLIAGDYVGRFNAGDIYVIGSGQPHQRKLQNLNPHRGLRINSGCGAH